MGKASREAPRGGIATYIGRRADLYRFIAPPWGDGVQKKFGGENKPSRGTALYYSEAKLLYRIGTREGDGQAPLPHAHPKRGS